MWATSHTFCESRSPGGLQGDRDDRHADRRIQLTRIAIDLLHKAMHRGVDVVPDDFPRSTALLGYAVLAVELEDVDAAAWLNPEVVPGSRRRT